MFIDHVGVIFFPEHKLFRYIGRLAFPIYCFALTQGYRFTHSMKSCMLRLATLMIISQIPYVLAFNSLTLNVIFTLFYSLIILWVVDVTKWYIWVPVSIVISIISELAEYGIYEIIMDTINYWGIFFYIMLYGVFLIGHLFSYLVCWGQS
ncbi:TraX family protein [Bacillus salitolerans]|uniref:TraX family protein n=1 Tax=Bacillus salitolerans TaxID=1437434 RepID=A0ABW4LQX7_9BACI